MNEIDVLVLGGGPAGTWAALKAAAAGATVTLADKGFCGSSGATAFRHRTGTAVSAPALTRRREVDYMRVTRSACRPARTAWPENPSTRVSHP